MDILIYNMVYYVLPRIECNINAKNIKLSFNPNDNRNSYKYSLKKYLFKIKGLIDKHIREWDNIKKYTNSHEFIHTTIPSQKLSVSKYKPISRAFFKLIEIYNKHQIFKNVTQPVNSFHLAEGPGGFIEATAYMRQNSYDNYYGMTLMESNNNIPNWNKAQHILEKYKNIHIEYGSDKKGDLYNHKNLEYCKKKYKNSMDVITADGGFDFSHDYNNQEICAFRLIFTQIGYALTMQKFNGHFILKIFDMFEKSTLDILFLLSCFYEKVIISKPSTSRSANSEKYVICKHFKYRNTEDITVRFINILKIFQTLDFNKYNINSILDIPINNYYKTQLFEINACITHCQIENILNTIKIITHKDKKYDKIQHLKSMNIQKCVKWCIENKIQHNTYFQNSNIFLGERIKNINKF